MSELIALATASITQRGIYLIITSDRARREKTDLIAHLLLNGPLFILSAAEWLPGFLLPRIIRGQTTQVKELSGRLRTVCASTSLRLLDSLTHIPAPGEPLLVLDFLHAFYDSAVRLSLRLRVLRQCCDHLKRIGVGRPVIVTTQELAGADYERFLPVLCKTAQKTLVLEPELERVFQPALL